MIPSYFMVTLLYESEDGSRRRDVHVMAETLGEAADAARSEIGDWSGRLVAAKQLRGVGWVDVLSEPP